MADISRNTATSQSRLPLTYWLARYEHALLGAVTTIGLLVL